jgi:hypothetical protein
MRMKIVAVADCIYCNGSGKVYDSVDYGATRTQIESICDCVYAQVPEDTEDFEVVDANSVRLVTVPSCDQHEGFSWNRTTITLQWVCPTCGKPRGEPFDTCSYDGSRKLGGVHGWHNDCGHTDYYVDVRAEANSNGLNLYVPH